MIFRGIATALAVFALAGAAGAQDFQAFVVKDIRVEGLQRTEAGTVFSYLPVKVGETMNADKARAALRALYATGFFSDVRLDVENDVLVVFVRERPAIAQIDFSGMKEFEPDNVRKVLRELGMAEGRIFDRALLDSAEQELKRQYLSKGMYAAAVQTTVTAMLMPTRLRSRSSGRISRRCARSISTAATSTSAWNRPRCRSPRTGATSTSP